jgi:hypothetical protein
MSKYLFSKLPIALFLAFVAPAAIPNAENTNGDSSFRGNRRPGILEAATEEPTGENALLYRRLGKLRPDELLDFVSETPAESASN